MSLPRKDVRLKLDHDMHAAAKAIADTEGVEIADWVEQVINGIIKKRVHAATVVVDQLAASGSLGTFRDGQGNEPTGTASLGAFVRDASAAFACSGVVLFRCVETDAGRDAGNE